MDKTLALFFNDDYFIAGVEPFKGKFRLITKQGMDKFPLYFYIDPVSYHIDYDFSYKADYEAGNPKAIGDFFKKITDRSQTYKWYDYDTEIIHLLGKITDDLSDLYFKYLERFTKEHFGKDDVIPVKIAYSDNIQEAARKVLENYLQEQKFEVLQQALPVPELLVSQYMKKNRFNFEKKTFAVLETIGQNLNMSIIAIHDEYDWGRSHFKVFENYGIDPRTQIIAETIVKEINKQEGILSSTEEERREYQRQNTKAQEVIQIIETQNRPYMQVTTNFAADTTREFSVNLSTEKIEDLTAIRIRQISRFFEYHFINETNLRVEDFDQIFLLGDMFDNDLVKREFKQYGNSRLTFLKDTESEMIIRALLDNEKDDEAETSGAQPGSNAEQDAEAPAAYAKKDFLTVENLTIGQQVKLLNNDPRPTKGDSMQEMKYLGNNQFMILQSTRSLQPNDVATVLTLAWVPGLKIQFDIERSGKFIGRFETREVQSIWVK